MAKQGPSGSCFSFTVTGGFDEYTTHRITASQRDRNGTERSVSHIASVHHKSRGMLPSAGTGLYCILQHAEEFCGFSMCK